jgi:predicted branched-subunit amino acid permease
MPPAVPPPSPHAADRSSLRWFLRGASYLFSIPSLMLATSFVGFTAMAMESGITQWQAVFMTLVVWALPAKIVLIGAIISGNSLAGAALAVALSSARMTPMVAALTPELQAPGGRRWVLYALSHFVAVTSWVAAMGGVRQVPREMRTAWYFGIGATLTCFNALVVGLVYELAPHMPPIVSAALFMLTPIYFLTTLWSSARERASLVAMVAGLVVGPVFGWLTPQFSLLFSGLVGGSIAFAWHRRYGRAKA